MAEPEWRWPDDPISEAVWAAVAIDQEPTPEMAITRYRTEKWAPEVVRESYGLPAWGPEQMTAAAWAGMARTATRRRDMAVRAAADKGATLRSLGTATGLVHAAIARIIQRG